jgi:putative sterol carrier protein
MAVTYPLLSQEWITAYLELWNRNPAAVEGTKGLGALVEMGVTDQDRPPVQLNVTLDGTADYAGPVQPGAEPFFRLMAPTETWRKVAHKEIGVRRAVTGPIKFQGSLLTALKYFGGLEAALLQFGDIPTTEWDAAA